MKFTTTSLAALSLLLAAEANQGLEKALEKMPGPEALQTYENIQKTGHFEGVIKIDYASPEEEAEENDDQQRMLRERILEGVQNEDWTNKGKVTDAAGRLLYTMKDENGKSVGKTCTATVICDFTEGRSLIATAAHCVVDDLGNFNTDFLFIPKQDDGGKDISNRICDDDPYGCWVVDHVIVDKSFADNPWPYTIPQDYAVLVVRDSSETHISCDPNPESGECLSEDGNPLKQPILDKAINGGVISGGMGIDCDNSQQLNGDKSVGDRTMIWMLGYSDAHDPNFRYCEDEVRDKTYSSFMQKNGGPYWYTKNCRLSKGASGGPVLPETQDDNAGSNKMVSIISFERMSIESGNIIGEGGPKLHDNSFCCLVQKAMTSPLDGTNIKFIWNGKKCSKKGGSWGDPHFETWGGEYFEYQGACDLVLADSPLFGDGLGFAAHVRTKARFDYSFIEYAAIKIGNDILEVGGYGSYMYNGVHMGEIGLMGGQYNVTTTVTNRDSTFVIHIMNSDQITIKAHKDLVSVGFADADERHFKDSVGMMGDYATGARLSRSGDIIQDDNIFAQEWQVRPGVDADIFHSKSGIQWPEKCSVPAPVQKGRRLGESISVEAATEACAQFTQKNALDACIYDVIATGDLEAAQSGAF